jgi:hypothetical protein
MLHGALNPSASTATMKVYEDGAEKLTVYTDVPGHSTSVINGYPSRAKSDIYEIWVRSAATDNVWVKCFANMTYNRALEMPTMPEYESAGSRHAYWKISAGWTHTYANIEMSAGSPVEVEIRKIGTTLLNGSSVIVKSAVHPAQKIVPDSKRDENGRVYFTITNPGQLVIDINGQMDDHNAAFPVGTPGGAMPGNPPVHTIALYANPIMVKPVASPTNTIVTVTPNQSSPTNPLYTAQPNPATYDTLVFAPGVHHIGPGFKVHPGKNYYIPGDAILYGNLSNEGVSQGSYRCTGDSINIYGYGTICGIVIPHYQSRTADDTANGTPNPQYPEYLGWPQPKDADVGIRIVQAWDTKITGVTVADPANFNTKFDVFAGRVNDQSLVSWVKLHSWRVNGDGCGGYVPIEDSLIRASDDNTYIRDWRRRCTFWKDSNANIFRFINYVAGGLEDCDVLYARFRFEGGAGNIFDFVGYSGSQSPVLTFKNIRFHDKLSNPRCIITLEPTTQAFINATFENVSFFTPLNNQLSEIIGGPSAPYTGRVMFKNVTFQNGLDGSSPVRLNQGNYSNYFTTSAYVDPSIFEPVALPVVTVSATDASAAEPGDNGTFTFTRSGSTAAALTVGFTVGGTATSGSDYASLGTSVTIAAGQASATKSVTVIDDTTAESSETVMVNLASGAGYTTGSPSSATVTIADNDVVLPTVTVAATDASAGEPADSGTFTFTRSGSTSGALTVNFTVGGTAASGSDYASLGTTVTLADGQASATKTVSVVDDAAVESSETVIVTLASGAGYTTGSPGSATVTIADNDVPAEETLPWTETFTLPDGTSSDGGPTSWTATPTGGGFRVLNNEMAFNNVGTDGVFTTSAINISAGPVTVSLKVRGGSGLDLGEDFLRLYKKVDGGPEVQIGAADGPQAATTWTANITSGSSLVLVVRAHVTASSEYYYFDDLSVTVTPPVLPTVTVAATDASAGEPANNGVFTFTRTGSTTADLTVNYTVGGTATSGVDYTSLGTSVTIPAGQASATKTVAVIDNATPESSETAIVTLASNAAYTIGSPSSATVTIADDDGLPSPWVTADIGAVSAAGSASYSNPTWTLVGSGGDIGGTSDEFRYVYQSASGDCSIVARVASIQNTNAWAMAGVMIRETTAANAQSMLLAVTPTSGVTLQWRTTTGGPTSGSTVTGQVAPKWLKLTRSGNSFAAYRSDNGTTWTQVGTTQTINMVTNTTMGLAVTSHADGTLCTSTMDNVIATP